MSVSASTHIGPERDFIELWNTLSWKHFHFWDKLKSFELQVESEKLINVGFEQLKVKKKKKKSKELNELFIRMAKLLIETAEFKRETSERNKKK